MFRLGTYEHYSGKRYKVIAIGKHSETLEEFVVYESLYDNPESRVWVRPRKMFEGEVDRDGKRIPRFRYLE